MLPLPCAPNASWAGFWERFRALFHGADPRVCAAFWLFGLINNVLYVIVLTAALDLVGPGVPKGIVLLADVVPAFITKLTAPYFIHVVPYPVRIIIFVGLSAWGMLLVALSPAYDSGGDGGPAASISSKLVGVVLASLSSGGGELSFLGLTHFYGPFSLAAWGSGTGAAGLVGAGMYALATTSFGFSVRTTLLASACLPAVMVLSFFIVLPRAPLRALSRAREDYRPVDGEEEETVEDRSVDTPNRSEGEVLDAGETDGLLAPALGGGSVDDPKGSTSMEKGEVSWVLFKAMLNRARGLVLPFMLPLLLVYIAEYTINQGVAPTLLFPLSSTPFAQFRSFYPTYNAIYQVGVFISRSSTPFYRTHNLYLPSLLQVLNLTLLTLHALFDFLPNVYIVFAVVFWEGLLGGLVYVNTFAEISDRVPNEDREFSLAATTVSDSAGICIAGLVGMVFEVWLCGWQVAHGRNYCQKT